MSVCVCVSVCPDDIPFDICITFLVFIENTQRLINIFSILSMIAEELHFDLGYKFQMLCGLAINYSNNLRLIMFQIMSFLIMFQIMSFLKMFQIMSF